MNQAWDADVVVVGSGFGGAVTALRLAEAGHRVIVAEKGRRLSDSDLLRARRDPRAYLWQPSVGLRGFFWQRIFQHVAVIGGTGVGGGSIVWAGVLLERSPWVGSRCNRLIGWLRCYREGFLIRRFGVRAPGDPLDRIALHCNDSTTRLPASR